MAKMNAKLTGIIVLIIAIVVIFQLVGSSANDLTNAAQNISLANQCSTILDGAGEAAYANYTAGECYNSTRLTTGTAINYLLPLRNLFSPSGVALIVFMAALLILIVVTVLKGSGKIGKK